MNTLYKKIINNKTVIDSRENIVLNRAIVIEDPETGENIEAYAQTYAPSEEMLLADGWEVYVDPGLTEEEMLASAKLNKIDSIIHYDSSDMVNIFYINDTPVWLDKNTRAGLMLRFNAEIAAQKEVTTLWYERMQFSLPLSDAIRMLYAIEVYASACYDNTQLHLSNIDKLDNLDEILNYDYTAGYPAKLYF